ncbi:SLC42A [Mytilus coruscus]|uniref:SLC42A n=1 Tax=Mytilus coruscus TaxID=42192 RepID=A0A6J7ZYK6_MYTCO|nr:SLC42A [Mytilus coruscus]
MSMALKKLKFSFLLISCQVIFVIIFGLLAEYEEPAQAKSRRGKTPVTTMYPMFQDVHVMIFIGFGFLMTFLKRYGYSAIGINLLLASFVIQWALIVRGFIHGNVMQGGKFSIGLSDMLTADFAAATVLISFGAVLGKTSALQLLIMAVIEVVLSQLNEHIGLELLNITIERLRSSVLDLQCQKLNKNFVFNGIDEKTDEVTDDLVKAFVRTELEIVREIFIVKSYRIGKHFDGKIRPIVVKFENRNDRQDIRFAAPKHVKGKPFGVNEHFPHEVVKICKELLPIHKEACKQKLKSVLKRDKLYIDGELLTKPNTVT